MTTYCKNRLFAYGSLSEILALVSFCENEAYDAFPALDVEKILPTPKGMLGDNAFEPTSEGMAWTNRNWGTPFTPSEPTKEYIGDLDGMGVKYSFETIGDASLPITKQLSSLFPALRFEHVWEIADFGFSGKFTAEDGVVLGNEEGNFGDFRCYPDNPERYRKDYYEEGDE